MAPIKCTRCVVTYAVVSGRKTQKWLDGFALYTESKEKLSLFDAQWKFLTSHKVEEDALVAGASFETGRYHIEIESVEHREADKHRGWDDYTPGEDVEAYLGPHVETLVDPHVETLVETPKRRIDPLEAPPPPPLKAIPQQDGVLIPVMYTEQKHKKQKIWKDGQLCFFAAQNKGLLYDTNNARIHSVALKSLADFEAADEIESGPFLLQWVSDTPVATPDAAFIKARDV